MNKALLFTIGLAFFIGCSPDSETGSENESVDLTTIINPDTAKAAAEFDDTNKGIYKGVFVSNDISYHGVLTVNLANDSQYNAILEYGDNQNQRIGFVRIDNELAVDSNVIEFRGNNAGFTLNVSDYTQPLVTEGYIDGQTAQAKLLKETSKNSVEVRTGTFFDPDDAAFHGSWDLLSNTPTTIVLRIGTITASFPVFVVEQVIVVRSGFPTMFTDEVMEDFTPGVACEIFSDEPNIPRFPFFTASATQGLNERAVAGQMSTFVGEVANWSLLYSAYAAAGLPGVDGLYYDIDCGEIVAGTWSWKGRSGHILVDPLP